MFPNYTVNDIVGVLVAFLISPIVFVMPGYLCAWLFDIMDFRKRLLFVQVVIGIVLSNGISPILLFLIYRFFSATVALAALLVITILAAFVFIISAFKSHSATPRFFELNRYQALAFFGAVIWMIFCIFFLVDWQFGNKLYFTSMSYDYTTRVSIIDAITRTGSVPPVNPGYYPGHPVPLTYLYYFWYILGSVLDNAGGSLVSAYQALIVGVAYCGLSLAGAMALYLRLRNQGSSRKIWKSALLSAQLFLVSGMDILPVVILFASFLILFRRMPMEGRIEGWNLMIMSWMNAIAWVPHHVSSAVACLTGLLLYLDSQKRGFQYKVINTILVGGCFASAVGLSVWVALTFTIFWAIWIFVQVFRKLGRQQIGWMVFSGLAALVLALPFILDLFRGSTGNTVHGLPIEFSVRPFILTQLLLFLPPSITPWFDFIFLPLNYYMELGFFSIIAFQWLRLKQKTGLMDNPYFLPEILMVLVVVINMSFFQSTALLLNDWGIRGWLPLQFILIVWTLDLYLNYQDQRTGEIKQVSSIFKFKNLSPGLQILLILGVMSSIAEVIIDRSWILLIDSGAAGTPHEVGPDTQIGARTYYARQAYEYANQHLPVQVIYQNNPTRSLDRSAGLYGSRQMVIADRSIYGVSQTEFTALVSNISPIFSINYWDWGQIDTICRQNNIDVLVINDLDPIWNSLPTLEKTRKPLYQNDFYTLLACGNFANQ